MRLCSKAAEKAELVAGSDVGGETQILESPKTCVAPNPHLKSILAEGFLEIQKKWG